MQTVQTKTIELFFTSLVFLALFSAAFHAKDVIAPKQHKLTKDDTVASARKIADDSHNHTDKFSFKAFKSGSAHNFGADSRSLKKQFLSDKKLQVLLD